MPGKCCTTELHPQLWRFITILEAEESEIQGPPAGKGLWATSSHDGRQKSKEGAGERARGDQTHFYNPLS